VSTYEEDLANPNIGHTEVAETWNRSEASVRRARKRLGVALVKSVKKEKSTDSSGRVERFRADSDGNVSIEVPTDHPMSPKEVREYLEGHGYDLRTTRYWHGWTATDDKVWNKLKVAPSPLERSGIDATALIEYTDKLFEGYSDFHEDREGKSTLIWCIGDLQLGKGAEDNGGIEYTVALFNDQLNRLLDKHEDFDSIVLVDAGDIVENINNAKDQALTNCLSVSEQVIMAHRLLLTAIKKFLDLGHGVWLVSVPSNHGAIRANFREPTQTWNDYGLMLNQMIEDSLTGLGAPFGAVRPNPTDGFASFTAAGVRFVVTHGHYGTNKAEDVPKWWQKQSFNYPAIDGDVLIHGHFHHWTSEDAGDGRLVFGCPSAEPGSNWYKLSQGGKSAHGFLVLAAKDGKVEVLSKFQRGKILA